VTRTAQGTKPTSAEIVALIERTRGPVTRILSRYNIPPADAEDVLHEAYLALVMRWDQIEVYEGWLIRVVQNLCAQWWRRRLHESLVQLDDLDPGLMAEVSTPAQQQVADRRLLEQLMTSLPARHRRLLMLLFVRGWSRSEAAANTGYELESVGVTVRRALTRLRQASDDLARGQRRKSPARRERPTTPWRVGRRGRPPCPKNDRTSGDDT
jgi:RNA polymerase sigma factor (sigma-70 family)